MQPDSKTKPRKRVRPLTLEEHRHVIEYFHSADDAFLVAMGVDKTKLRSRDNWFVLMKTEYDKPLKKKTLCYLGWEYDGKLIGHSNISDANFGDTAKVHLHLWHDDTRMKGLGTWFFKQSVNWFLRNFELRLITCEPHADNDAPNRVLQKLGLTPLKTYLTVPGPFNSEQMVTRYEITAPFDD